MAAGQVQSDQSQETTPLLPRQDEGNQPEGRDTGTVLFRILLCGFLVSTSFGVTQVP
jgi:hypothetical protein